MKPYEFAFALLLRLLSAALYCLFYQSAYRITWFRMRNIDQRMCKKRRN